MLTRYPTTVARPNLLLSSLFVVVLVGGEAAWGSIQCSAGVWAGVEANGLVETPLEAPALAPSDALPSAKHLTTEHLDATLERLASTAGAMGDVLKDASDENVGIMAEPATSQPRQVPLAPTHPARDKPGPAFLTVGHTGTSNAGTSSVGAPVGVGGGHAQAPSPLAIVVETPPATRRLAEAAPFLPDPPGTELLRPPRA